MIPHFYFSLTVPKWDCSSPLEVSKTKAVESKCTKPLESLRASSVHWDRQHIWPGPWSIKKQTRPDQAKG